MRQLALGCLLLLLTAPPIAAEWLVMNDGARFETRGEWRVKGAAVVFTNRQGTFSSLPLSEIDLETSRRASSPQPAVQLARAPVAPRQPMMTLTNADIGPARRPLPARPAEPAQGLDDGATGFEDAGFEDTVFEDAGFDDAEEFGEEGVRWHRVKDGEFDGVEVVGTLGNDGEGMVTDLGVMVSLRDRHDQVIATQRAVVQARSLMPGSFTRFQARFADLEIEDDEQTRVEVHCQAKRLREKAE